MAHTPSPSPDNHTTTPTTKTSSTSIASLIGTATLIAVFLGLGVWIIEQFVLGADGVTAVRHGASAAGAVLLIAAIIGVVRSLQAGRK